MGKIYAFDLDGTLTQHRTPLDEEHRILLDEVGKRGRLLIVGAGDARRIFRQMGCYPIDIIGNYGMQYMRYNVEKDDLISVFDEVLPADRESVLERVSILRENHGYTAFDGECVEFHSSGMVTIPLLGTEATIGSKIAFDPDRRKRRAIYGDVCVLFPEYNVFVGGSSSFDMVPRPYDKKYALDRFCQMEGISKEDIIYTGDDYGTGGNDEPVYRSEYRFIRIGDYRETPHVLRTFLEAGIL